MSIGIEGNNTIKPFAWGDAEITDGVGLNGVFEFNWPDGTNADSITLVVLHETVEVGNGPATLSALSWAVEAPSREVQGFGWVVMILFSCAIATIFLRSKVSF